MKHSTINNVKFLRLKRKLMLGQWQTIGILESLWMFAIHSAPDGAIGRFLNEDIAAAMDYNGDADLLISVLIECGWIDVDPLHRLLIHDWIEHAPNYLKANFTKAGKEFATSVKEMKPRKPLPPRKIVTPPIATHDAPQVAPQEQSNPDARGTSGGTTGGLEPQRARHQRSVLRSHPSTLPISLTYSSLTDSNLTDSSLGDSGSSSGATDPHSKKDLDPSASELAREWVFYAKGSRPGNELLPKILESFAEVLRCKQQAFPQVLAAIKDSGRDRTEPLFLFLDREIRGRKTRLNTAGKSTEEIYDAMMADPKQRELLEVAYGINQ